MVFVAAHPVTSEEISEESVTENGTCDNRSVEILIKNSKALSVKFSNISLFSLIYYTILALELNVHSKGIIFFININNFY